MCIVHFSNNCVGWLLLGVTASEAVAPAPAPLAAAGYEELQSGSLDTLRCLIDKVTDADVRKQLLEVHGQVTMEMSQTQRENTSLKQNLQLSEKVNYTKESMQRASSSGTIY